MSCGRSAGETQKKIKERWCEFMYIIEKKLKNVHFACGGKETKLSSNEALNEIVKMLKSK